MAAVQTHDVRATITINVDTEIWCGGWYVLNVWSSVTPVLYRTVNSKMTAFRNVNTLRNAQQRRGLV